MLHKGWKLFFTYACVMFYLKEDNELTLFNTFGYRDDVTSVLLVHRLTYSLQHISLSTIF